MSQNPGAVENRPMNAVGWVLVVVASVISLAALIAVVGGIEVAVLLLIVGLGIFTSGIGVLAAARN